MVGSRMLLLLLSGMLFGPPVVSRATAATTAHLVIAPGVGHSGDSVFLSGSGFRPGARLSFSYSCGGQSGTVKMSGPQVSAQGQFVAYHGLRIRAPRAGACRVAGTDGTLTATASYRLLPQLQSLPKCARNMCVTVTAVLVRVRQGVQGNISIKGWPGAIAALVLTAPNRGTQHAQVRLGWRGTGGARFPLGPGLRTALNARIHVRAYLAGYSGSSTASFVVVPGGR